MNTVVWIMVSMVHGGYAFGPEFSTPDKCVAAAKTIHQTMLKVSDWNYNVPTCIRIEK
jgi:hypothetical protein